MYAQNMANLLRHVHGKGGLDEWKIWKPGSLKQNLQKGWSFKSLISTWNAKCPIFLGNWTPKTSNYCLKNRALGFPGTHVNDQFRNTCLKLSWKWTEIKVFLFYRRLGRFLFFKKWDKKRVGVVGKWSTLLGTFTYPLVPSRFRHFWGCSLSVGYGFVP